MVRPSDIVVPMKSTRAVSNFGLFVRPLIVSHFTLAALSTNYEVPFADSAAVRNIKRAPLLSISTSTVLLAVSNIPFPHAGILEGSCSEFLRRIDLLFTKLKPRQWLFTRRSSPVSLSPTRIDTPKPSTNIHDYVYFCSVNGDGGNRRQANQHMQEITNLF